MKQREIMSVGVCYWICANFGPSPVLKTCNLKVEHLGWMSTLELVASFGLTEMSYHML
jgi:hypothetical protein